MNPLGLFLDPPGPLLTHFYTVYMGCSERLPTRLNPLAERTRFPQVYDYLLEIGMKPVVALSWSPDELVGGSKECSQVSHRRRSHAATFLMYNHTQ